MNSEKMSSGNNQDDIATDWESVAAMAGDQTVNANDKEDQKDFRKTFGQKVVEIFNAENASADAQDEYLKRIQEERALLETLDPEQRAFQDYIFYKAIEDNPNGSQFIKSIPGLDTRKIITEQLLEKNEDGLYEIPDETVGNILEFYQSVLKEKEAEFAGEFEEALSNYESNLKDRVTKGKLPQALYENYKKVKDENGGSIVSDVKLFDLRPEENSSDYENPFVAAYVEFRGLSNKGESNYPGNIKQIMYRKFFLTQQEKANLGSIDIMMNHEMTHIIAGKEASFNLLCSGSGRAEDKINEAYREGMTEAIGQMIADSSPEADNYSLRHYFRRSETGTYPGDREFLAKLINVDERYRNENQDLDEQESLENLFLEAYAETDGDKYTNALRNRLYFIFDNWEDAIKDEDFPDSDLNFFRGRAKMTGASILGRLCLDEIKLKYAYQER